MYAQPPSSLRLRDAVATVLRDRSWWRHCLVNGALLLSLIGMPLAAGFVLESYDNSRRGYPTPLPPWSDWSLRAIGGFLALLIDFVFFLVPLFALLLLIMLSGVLLLAGGLLSTAAQGGWFNWFVALGWIVPLIMYLSGAAPLARLALTREGKIEDALDIAVLKNGWQRRRRRLTLRARLASLPAALPAVALSAIFFSVAQISFSGQNWVLLLIAWLTAAAWIFAQLVEVQIFTAAERLA
jgi:hypothetical protein